MKGIIFNLLEEFVTAELGPDALEDLLSSTPLETSDPFVGPGSYPDEDLVALVAATSARLGKDTQAVLVAFGRFCVAPLAARFPELLAPHGTPKALLLAMNDLHRIEVQKLYPDARPPVFEYDDPAPNELVMRYRSARGLCALVSGLIEGVAAHYGVPIAQRQTSCAALGGACCEFHLEFGSAWSGS